jgi:hypothetical protein
LVGIFNCTDIRKNAEDRQINSEDKVPRFNINDLVRTEEESFERVFENDDHWRNVFPATHGPRPVHFVRLVRRLPAPISHSLKLDQLGDLAGIGAATVLSVLVLVLISFAAGIVARTVIGGRLRRWAEAFRVDRN